MEPQLKEREKNEEESARAARARREARGPHAQRRHARGRRADRARQAHRFLPALRRGRLGGGGLPVRHERRRGDRARQVRLPRADHAHDPRLDAALRRSGSIPPRTLALESLPLDDKATYQIVRGRQHDRGVPVRIARHARSAQARAARPLRGHHRAGRALPAGADGPHPRFHRAQARPGARRVSRPARRADPRRDLRHHGVPGAGDADGADHRRLQPRRRRPAAPRDGQEAARGDGAAPRHLRRGRGEERRRRAQGRRALRPDGEVRGLRLQQVARRRLRAGRVPDGVHEGASRCRVHGGEHVGGDGRHRQGAAVPDDAVRERARGAAARHQRGRIPLRAARYEDDPLRPGRDQGHRRGGDRRTSSRRAGEGGPFADLFDFCRARRQAHRQPAHGRIAGARRRVRCARPTPRAACSRRSASRSKRRAGERVRSR